MIRITRIFRFEAAHALFNHKGACKNIHGHSYVLEVTVGGLPFTQAGSSEGMVMDFADLKAIVHAEIVDRYDHSLILNRNYYDEKSIPDSMRGRINWLEVEPTSENMLLLFAGKLQPLLPAGVKLIKLVLRETATSYAEWLAEENG